MRLLITWSLVFFALFGYAQDPLTNLSYLYQTPVGNTEIMGLEQDSAKNVYLLGKIASDISYKGETLSVLGESSLLLVKMDSAENLVWYRTLEMDADSNLYESRLHITEGGDLMVYGKQEAGIISNGNQDLVFVDPEGDGQSLIWMVDVEGQDLYWEKTSVAIKDVHTSLNHWYLVSERQVNVFSFSDFTEAFSLALDVDLETLSELDDELYLTGNFRDSLEWGDTTYYGEPIDIFIARVDDSLQAEWVYISSQSGTSGGHFIYSPAYSTDDDTGVVRFVVKKNSGIFIIDGNVENNALPAQISLNDAGELVQVKNSVFQTVGSGNRIEIEENDKYRAWRNGNLAYLETIETGDFLSGNYFVNSKYTSHLVQLRESLFWGYQRYSDDTLVSTANFEGDAEYRNVRDIVADKAGNYYVKQFVRGKYVSAKTEEIFEDQACVIARYTPNHQLDWEFICRGKGQIAQGVSGNNFFEISKAGNLYFNLEYEETLRVGNDTLTSDSTSTALVCLGTNGEYKWSKRLLQDIGDLNEGDRRYQGISASDNGTVSVMTTFEFYAIEEVFDKNGNSKYTNTYQGIPRRPSGGRVSYAAALHWDNRSVVMFDMADPSDLIITNHNDTIESDSLPGEQFFILVLDEEGKLKDTIDFISLESQDMGWFVSYTFWRPQKIGDSKFMFDFLFYPWLGNQQAVQLKVGGELFEYVPYDFVDWQYLLDFYFVSYDLDTRSVDWVKNSKVDYQVTEAHTVSETGELYMSTHITTENLGKFTMGDSLYEEPGLYYLKLDNSGNQEWVHRQPAHGNVGNIYNSEFAILGNDQFYHGFTTDRGWVQLENEKVEVNGNWLLIGHNTDVLVGKQEEERVQLMIYPNPTEELITIQSESLIEQIQLLDIHGKKVRNEVLSGLSTMARFDLGDLPAGMYIIEIQLENNWIRQSVIKK